MSLNFLKLNNNKILMIGSAGSVKRMDLSFEVDGVHVKPYSSILNLGVVLDSTIFLLLYFCLLIFLFFFSFL